MLISIHLSSAVSMQSEAPLISILSPLRAGRGELERTCLGSLLGDPDTVSSKVPLPLRKRERVRVRVRLDCMDTAQLSIIETKRPQFRVPGFAVRAHQHF